MIFNSYVSLPEGSWKKKKNAGEKCVEAGHPATLWSEAIDQLVAWDPTQREDQTLGWPQQKGSPGMGKFRENSWCWYVYICLPWCPLQKLLEYPACCLEKKSRVSHFIINKEKFYGNSHIMRMVKKTYDTRWYQICGVDIHKQQLSWCWAKVWIHRHKESISQKWLWIKSLVPWWTAEYLPFPKKYGAS